VRLVCREGEFDTLLAELALHRLDVVLTDRPAPHGGNLKVFSHALGEFEITLFAAPELAGATARDSPTISTTRRCCCRRAATRCAGRSNAGWKPTTLRR
jgi:DNA-binding transcriptional LysR family regulator